MMKWVPIGAQRMLYPKLIQMLVLRSPDMMKRVPKGAQNQLYHELIQMQMLYYKSIQIQKHHQLLGMCRCTARKSWTQISHEPIQMQMIMMKRVPIGAQIKLYQESMQVTGVCAAQLCDTLVSFLLLGLCTVL